MPYFAHQLTTPHIRACQHAPTCPCGCPFCEPRTPETPPEDIAGVLGHAGCCLCLACLDYVMGDHADLESDDVVVPLFPESGEEVA